MTQLRAIFFQLGVVFAELGAITVYFFASFMHVSKVLVTPSCVVVSAFVIANVPMVAARITMPVKTPVMLVMIKFLRMTLLPALVQPMIGRVGMVTAAFLVCRRPDSRQ
jgi:hypothetical protein